MIIISDCLTNKLDEGCIKVAASLVKRIKKNADTFVIAYGMKEPAEYCDAVVCTNKLFTNKELTSLIDKKAGPIIYMPFSSNSKGGIVRSYMLAKKTGKKVYSLFALRHPMGVISKFILKRSGVKILVLSKESFDFYSNELDNEIVYLKTGIDSNKFTAITEDRKNEIRRKYNISENEKVVLHVGHLKEGRNVDKLLDIPDDYKVILVVSSVTEKETELEHKIRAKDNILLIDEYCENIEEIYQMADVYLFPVMETQNCIDVPLSVIEAAACNLPIVCTPYGELKEFRGNDGFEFVDDINAQSLMEALDKMIGKKVDSRNAVLEYDWNNAVNILEKMK